MLLALRVRCNIARCSDPLHDPYVFAHRRPCREIYIGTRSIQQGAHVEDLTHEPITARANFTPNNPLGTMGSMLYHWPLPYIVFMVNRHELDPTTQKWTRNRLQENVQACFQHPLRAGPGKSRHCVYQMIHLSHTINACMRETMEQLIPDNLTFTDVGHLPIVKEFAKHINLIDTINSMVQSQMQLPPGQTVLVFMGTMS